jgi:hypothetical protein
MLMALTTFLDARQIPSLDAWLDTLIFGLRLIQHLFRCGLPNTPASPIAASSMPTLATTSDTYRTMEQ